jgi:predicted NBD/HSP70 family sugar kinase
LLKGLLWAWGGNRVTVSGAPEIVAGLSRIYHPGGGRDFDQAFLGRTCFRDSFSIQEGPTGTHGPAATPGQAGIGRHLDGCRIGFDLGGSDRKCAALIDGKVVFSEEVKWNPYFESDPAYHREGIRQTLQRAAEHLPRVDAIGGSAAGIYIANEPRVASLFRGLSPEDFDRSIRGLFHEIRREWGDIPFEIANDGDVTALAGALSIQQNAILGISMGTSLAAGYIDRNGHITGWLNELAFVPVDYRTDAPADEWSGDLGCGVQYFSQQGVGRLLAASGLPVDPADGLPEQLEVVQAKMAAGDERAAAIYDTIGTCLGYALGHYADLYDFKHFLLLGRVSSGLGGDRILSEARQVLDGEFPDLSANLEFHLPDEGTKRHGQAVAAASLPRISPIL